MKWIVFVLDQVLFIFNQEEFVWSDISAQQESETAGQCRG